MTRSIMLDASYSKKQKELSKEHSNEVKRGERFEFGANWLQFLSVLTEERIVSAEKSLQEMFEIDDFSKKTFLDIGSGSGLFSLAARRLGAKVHSFDFDPDSFGCTQTLRDRYFKGDENWTVEQGSALNEVYINSLGKFDLVYSWGVLHHTGDMWRAIENSIGTVNEGGRFCIAIYNDTGTQAVRWRAIKKFYCQLPEFLKTPFAALAAAPNEGKLLLSNCLRLKPMEYVRSWTEYRTARGMNRWYDIVDWVGGYPYEVATPDELFDYFKKRGFTVTKLKLGRVGLGCNQFVFEKTPK